MAGDINYGNVSLLLHCNGADNSTTFTDNSPTPKTVSANGNAKIVTGQSKFGGASAYFDGTGDYLTVPHSTGLDLTTGDFTIEAWVYCTALIATTQEIIDKDGVSGSSYPSYALGITSDGHLWAFLGNGNGTSPAGTTYTGSTALSVNTWHHVALVKTGSTCKGYLDGVQQWSSAAATMYNGSKPLVIASYQGQTSGTSFRGYVDDLRITKGVARYIIDFTPPAATFPDIGASFSISGSISESLAANTFIARAYDVETGVLVGAVSFTGTSSFTIDLFGAATACTVTVSADYKPWKASTVYALDDKVFPLDPIAKPYYYKRIVAGTSGAVEPTWLSPAGQCNDGAVTNAWELVERLIQPVTHGPLIPI